MLSLNSTWKQSVVLATGTRFWYQTTSSCIITAREYRELQSHTEMQNTRQFIRVEFQTHFQQILFLSLGKHQTIIWQVVEFCTLIKTRQRLLEHSYSQEYRQLSREIVSWINKADIREIILLIGGNTLWRERSVRNPISEIVTNDNLKERIVLLNSKKETIIL